MTEEVMPTLPMPRADLEAYRDQLLDRFANPALKHRTWQIAMDGTPEAAAAPARHHPRPAGQAGSRFERLALGVAAWMRYVTGIDEQGGADRRQGPARRPAARHRRRGRRRRGRSWPTGCWPSPRCSAADLPANAGVPEAVTRHLKSLLEVGAKETVRRAS